MKPTNSNYLVSQDGRSVTVYGPDDICKLVADVDQLTIDKCEFIIHRRDDATDEFGAYITTYKTAPRLGKTVENLFCCKSLNTYIETEEYMKSQGGEYISLDCNGEILFQNSKGMFITIYVSESGYIG